MRVLIVRFSSFGDIFQALEAAAHLSQQRGAEANDVSKLGWLVRADFAGLLHGQSSIDTVHAFERKNSFLALVATAWRLAGEYDALYDAHNNLRSMIVRFLFRLRWLVTGRLASFCGKVIVRPKSRWRRFLFFRFRLPVLPSPFRGAESYVLPLRRWFPDLTLRFDGVTWRAHAIALNAFQEWKRLNQNPIIALAPSAAWPNKRWPVERWTELVAQAPPNFRFLLLGGPDDRFLDEIANRFGADRVFSAVGKVSIDESASLVAACAAIVANDTGLLHVADRLQLPHVAIIGPTAFGYTVSARGRTAEVDRKVLPCKPCSKDGRDPCRNSIQLQCMRDVSVAHVLRDLDSALLSPIASECV